MPQIAKVIVDVPTMQTNRPYDYQVPVTLVDVIQPGMRVIIPFGMVIVRFRALSCKF